MAIDTRYPISTYEGRTNNPFRNAPQQPGGVWGSGALTGASMAGRPNHCISIPQSKQ